MLPPPYRRLLASTILLVALFCLGRFCQGLLPRTASEDGSVDLGETAKRKLLANVQHVLEEAVRFARENDEFLHSTLAKDSSATSFDSASDDGPRNTSGIDVCNLLAAQRLVFIGGAQSYHLHNLLLKALPPYGNASCLGPEFCTFHHLCAPGFLASRPGISTLHERESDSGPHSLAPQSSIIHSLLEPHRPSTEESRVKRPPSGIELSQTESFLLRYVQSDTLHPSESASSEVFTRPFVMPVLRTSSSHGGLECSRTFASVCDREGVRAHETPWTLSLRRSSMTLLSRDPIPAPPSTYIADQSRADRLQNIQPGSRPGNWAFASSLPEYLPLASHLASSHSHSQGRLKYDVEVINAALHATLSIFLPEVLRSLSLVRSIISTPSRRETIRVMWVGSYFCPSSGSSGHNEEDAWLRARDPWSTYHDAQVYFQTYILSRLLPSYGIPLIDMTSMAPRRKQGARLSVKSLDQEIVSNHAGNIAADGHTVHPNPFFSPAHGLRMNKFPAEPAASNAHVESQTNVPRRQGSADCVHSRKERDDEHLDVLIEGLSAVLAI